MSQPFTNERPTLLTFTLSHFSEKVRWGLDLAGVRYNERSLAPGAHVFTVKRLAKRSHVPVLIHGNSVVQGSGDILDYATEHLQAERLRAPSAEVAERKRLEQWLDAEIGRSVQTILYAELLEHRRLVTDLWYGDRNWLQRNLYPLLFPLLAPKVERMYRVDSAPDARRRFAEAWDVLEKHLLAGQHFDLANPGRFDVTVAALLAPVCQPPEHVVKWPALPPRLADFVNSYSARPLSRFVRDLYRTARH